MMPDLPNTPPSDSAASPRSSLGLMIGMVALVGLAAGGAWLYTRQSSPQQNTQAVQTPAPAPVAPPLFSESLGDIEVATPLGPMSFKGVKTLKANLNKAEVTAALQGDAELFAKLDAEAVSVESARFVQKFGASFDETLYDALEARDIKGGVIGTLNMPKSKMTGRKGDNSEHVMVMEGMSIESLDVPLMLRWYSASDPEGKAEFKPLSRRYTIKSIRSEDDEYVIETGAITGADFMVRPGRRPVGKLIRYPLGEYGAFLDAEAMPRDPVASMMLAADVLSSFELGPYSIEGIKFYEKKKNKDAEAPEDELRGEMRKIAFSGGKAGTFQQEGLRLSFKDGKFSLDKLEFRGNFTALLFAAIEKSIRARSGSPNPGDEELRKAVGAGLAGGIPDVRLALEGMAGDFPDAKDKAEANRIVFSLGSFSLNSGSFVGFTPTQIEYRLDNLDVPLPSSSKEASVIALRDMGLERLNLGMRIALGWTEASQALAVKEISLDFAQLARLALSGEITGVPLAFFEDPQTNWPSAMGAAIKALAVDVDNRGGLGKLIDAAAKEQKKTGEQLRKEYSTIAPLLIAGVLAGHPDAGKLAQGVTDFIRHLNSLRIKITAAGPNGIVLTDLATLNSNPAEFVQKLRFEVEGK